MLMNNGSTKSGAFPQNTCPHCGCRMGYSCVLCGHQVSTPASGGGGADSLPRLVFDADTDVSACLQAAFEGIPVPREVGFAVVLDQRQGVGACLQFAYETPSMPGSPAGTTVH